MRPIDADKIVAYLHKQLEFAKLNNDRCLKVAFKHAILKLDNATTIDAVPVVRCKDCRHWGTGFAGETDRIKECQFAGYMVGENGYCVYAEEKDADANDNDIKSLTRDEMIEILLAFCDGRSAENCNMCPALKIPEDGIYHERQEDRTYEKFGCENFHDRTNGELLACIERIRAECV